MTVNCCNCSCPRALRTHVHKSSPWRARERLAIQPSQHNVSSAQERRQAPKHKTRQGKIGVNRVPCLRGKANANHSSHTPLFTHAVYTKTQGNICTCVKEAHQDEKNTVRPSAVFRPLPWSSRPARVPDPAVCLPPLLPISPREPNPAESSRAEPRVKPTPAEHVALESSWLQLGATSSSVR